MNLFLFVISSLNISVLDRCRVGSKDEGCIPPCPVLSWLVFASQMLWIGKHRWVLQEPGFPLEPTTPKAVTAGPETGKDVTGIIPGKSRAPFCNCFYYFTYNRGLRRNAKFGICKGERKWIRGGNPNRQRAIYLTTIPLPLSLLVIGSPTGCFLMSDLLGCL